MFGLMLLIFTLGYGMIALEHPLKINKSATALLLAVALWVAVVSGGENILAFPAAFQQYLTDSPNGSFALWVSHHALLGHLGEISEILFFLLGVENVF